MAEAPALPASADFPARVHPPVPLWSESYAWWSWDDANDLSIYAHFQRHPDKPSLWRAAVALSRSGEVFGLNTYGAACTPFGPGFSAAHIAIERPHARWRLRVDAAAYHQALDEHMARAIHDAPAIPFFIDLAMDFRSPPWSLQPKEAKASMVSSEHYEQTGAVTGVVHLGENAFEVQCLGANDHSHGVRDFETLRSGGFFLPAVFPSGRSLTASKVSGEPDAISIGYLHPGDGALLPSRRVTPPSRWPAPGESDAVTIETETRTAEIQVTPLERRVFMTIVPPNFEHVGRLKGEETAMYYCDWSCRVKWDGEIGAGSLQMCLRQDR